MIKLKDILMEGVDFKSAGIIVYVMEDEPKFLYLKNNANWGWPKGGVDKGETDKQAAIRETFEETGIRIKTVHPKFKEVTSFNVKWDWENNRPFTKLKKKQVTYYLAEAPSKTVKLSFEHSAYKWLSYTEAMSADVFNKDILTKAYKLIT